MKKKAFLAIVIFVCAMFFTGMEAREAGAIDIQLDGFCDVLSLDIDGAIVYGTETGCSTGVAILGSLAFVPGEGIVLDLSVGDFSGFANRRWLYYIRFNGTWSNYYSDGGPPNHLNDGTWSFGPAVGGGGQNSQEE
ncbi:MAG: hypothetical protein JSW13_05855 [Candidatus Aerophobus sp.]|nr:MAG: hypothetical protein JSW13_05855 [Candidatus Aerophobus sp.]